MALGNSSVQAAQTGEFPEVRAIANLPPQWEGSCDIYTRKDLEVIRAAGLDIPAGHECTIWFQQRLLISLDVSFDVPHVIRNIRVVPSFASAYAPISLQLNDGKTYQLPPEPRDPNNPSGVSAGWNPPVSQEIIAYMQRASTVSLRYTGATIGVKVGLVPAGRQEVTLSLKTFPQARKALQIAARQIPPLR